MKKQLFPTLMLITVVAVALIALSSCSNNDDIQPLKTVGFGVQAKDKGAFKASIHWTVNGVTLHESVTNSYGFGTSAQLKPGEKIVINITTSDDVVIYTDNNNEFAVSSGEDFIIIAK